MGLPEESHFQYRQVMTPGQPILSIGALRRALSEERLSAYSTSSDSDALDAAARYVWNGALATAMVPALHALEVTLRNNIFAASLKIVDEQALRFGEVPCWLDAEPSLLYKKSKRTSNKPRSYLGRAEGH